MLFNSLEFIIFLPIVFVLYWFVINKNLKKQNILLLIASYVFYGWWDWRFLFLLIGMALSNYFIGIKIENFESKGKMNRWILLGLLINIGTLCIFKYFNFFIDSFINFISVFGYQIPRSSTRIVLPIGISFYTFLSISYLIDIFKKNISAHRNIVEVLLCLSFFPIILAGPIQRPGALLPQISEKRSFDYANMVNGLRQILWGLFKKIVLADTCAANADYIFNNHNTLDGSILVLGAIFFGFQLYGDFSGYSDMAIGIGRLFGFNLMQNFAYPYFARDIAMFWQRWHISLTTWFRDYLFFPVCCFISAKLSRMKYLSIHSDLVVYIIASSITWFVTGLWHGANYTFIAWGMIHGFFLIIFQWQKKPRKLLLKKLKVSNDNGLIITFETLITLTIVMFAWIFFRAASIGEAFLYIKDIFKNGIFTLSVLNIRGRGISSTLIDASIAIGVVFLIEWVQRNKQHGLEIRNYPMALRWSIYWVITFFCLIYLGDERTFVYFQF